MMRKNHERNNSESSDDKLTIMRRDYEYSKQSRFEELFKKYSKKQKVTSDRRYEYLNLIKQRSMMSRIRHSEAAMRRQSLYEEKGKKVSERKSKSAERFKRSSSCIDLRLCSNPDTLTNLSNCLLSGTAGFGKGVGRKPHELFCDSKQGMNIINTSIYSKISPERRSSSNIIRSSHSLFQLVDSAVFSDNFDSKENRAIVGKEHKMMADKHFIDLEIISNALGGEYPQSFDSNINVGRTSKRVCFNTSKYPQMNDKPILKKSIILKTPDTRRGILMRMCSLNSKQSSQGYSIYGPGLMMRESTMPEITVDDMSIAEKGDDLKHPSADANKQNLKSESTNTEPLSKSISVTSITTAFRIQDVGEKWPSNCGQLLHTCEMEQKNRKLKLAQLRQDLLNTERETNILKVKNEEVTKKLIYKIQRPVSEIEENVTYECLPEKFRSKAILL